MFIKHLLRTKPVAGTTGNNRMNKKQLLLQGTFSLVDKKTKTQKGIKVEHRKGHKNRDRP